MRSEGTSRIRVRVPGGEYPVLVGRGLLARLPELLAERAPAHRYVLIADDRVAGLYGEAAVHGLRQAGAAADLFSFPEGEANKTRESWAQLSDRMLEAGVGRDAAVVAMGGGVTGDLAGFVAATYMRGLPLVQVPTSLLAMVDSSVGGKTGVDTPAGKNLIGAFLQPRLVVADVDALRTLEPRQLRAGLAEAVKHGTIADAGHLEWIEAQADALLDARPEALAPVVVHSVQIKAGVVERDEREGGPRKTLNFGHTLGHALEAASRFAVLHGEAVAVGMVLEARLGTRLGVTESGTAEHLTRVLQRLHLPAALPPGVSADALLTATRSDKKARSGRVEYALLERIGAASAGPSGGWSWPVDDAEVRSLLAERP